MAAALLVAKDWPVRASIIILLLGSVGLVLAVCQLLFDVRALRGLSAKPERPAFEVEALEHHGRWGSLEIWVWLWALFLAIHLIGFLAALPLFVFLYVKLYGGSWPTTLILSGGTWAFLYGIFEQVLHVPWPKPWLALLLT
jgi:hypothetical protein